MKNSSDILRELQQLRKIWREQDFNLTPSQQARYDELLLLRRAFVSHWQQNGQVWTAADRAASVHGHSHVGDAA